MTNWKSISYKIDSWIRKINIFSERWHRWYNPYYYWWEVKKYVKKPKAHLVKGEFFGYFGLPCRTDAYRGLQFFCKGLGWKEKYDSPRHEWDPIICFIFTTPWKVWVDNKFSDEVRPDGRRGFYKHKSWWFGWVFNWYNGKGNFTENTATWEMILDMVEWNNSIEKAESLHHWGSDYDKNTDKYRRIIRPFNNLTKLGKQKVLEYESKCRSCDISDD